MQAPLEDSLIYLGTIDDMVVKYPWRFEVDKQRLHHSLVVQLVTGCPIVLNDGYLTHHPVAQEALLNTRGLLWSLVECGFVRVMARGYGRYGLHEMPERMANQGGVQSFKDLIASPVWPELRNRLKRLDQQLTAQGHLIPWPPYDTGSGYLALGQQLLDSSTAGSAGLLPHVSDKAFKEFLERFIDRMNTDLRGPRSAWEALAKQQADVPGTTRTPKDFVHALMNLGVELYHYNVGAMLASERPGSVSVETQISPAFDDIVAPQQDVLLDELPHLPRLRVPRIMTSVEPELLVKVLSFGSRQNWLSVSDAHARGAASLLEMRDAGETYARDLSQHLGEHVKYNESECLFDYVLSKTLECPSSKISTVATVAAVAGAKLLGADDVTTSAVGLGTKFVAGYVVTRLKKRYLGAVVKKVRFQVLERQILPPNVLRASAATLERITNRQVPSALVIDRARALALTQKMTRFDKAS